MLAVVAAFVSFASCGNAGAQKAAEDEEADISPLQKLLIRSHRLRLLPLPPLLLIRPLLTLPPLPLRNNSATDRFTDKNSKRLPMESLTIFIPVTLLILSYSILLFPSYLITIYIIILNYFFRFPVFLFAVYRLSNGSQITGSQ